MNTIHQNLIIGALTADAATLGLHWLYDQQRILNVAGKMPEFHPPTKSDYEGVPSFFAHGEKAVGDLSHYGEQAFVLLAALSSSAGHYSPARYQDSFKSHFSYGGSYVGYIDWPTKSTLDNITIAEHHSLKQARALNLNNVGDKQQNIINLTLSYLKKDNTISACNLKSIIEKDLEIDPDVSELASLIECLQPLTTVKGADDVQLPAISKLPALVSVFVNQPELVEYTESAVRVTNDNDLAVNYGNIASKMMAAAILTQDIDEVIEAGRQAATPEILLLIDAALNASNKTTSELTKEIGMSCNLEFGIPSVFHTLNQHLSYQDAIRQNCLAGGDSCGRSILLGAVLGAVQGVGTEHGIPEAWWHKVNKKQAVVHLLASL